MEFYNELLLQVPNTMMSDKYIYPYTKGQQKAIQREIERSLNHGRTKLKFLIRP
jgi:hypothetical protein